MTVFEKIVRLGKHDTKRRGKTWRHMNMKQNKIYIWVANKKASIILLYTHLFRSWEFDAYAKL